MPNALTFDMIARDKASKAIKDVGKSAATSAGQMDKAGKSAKTAADGIDKAGQAARSVSDELDKAGESTEGLGEQFKKIATGAGALAGIGLGAAFVESLDVEAANDKLAGQLGLTEKESKRVGGIAGSLYAGAYGESMEEVNNAVGAVMSSIDGMGKASSKRLETTTKSVLNFASAFEVDVQRAAQIAGQVVRNDLAANADQAFNLLIASSQQVPAAVREDLLEAVDEYGTFFRTLGFDGKQAFGVLVEASEQGMYGIDKAGDAIKEFTVRATDGSDLTQTAFEGIGLDADKMSNRILAGGDTARKAFDRVIEGLLNIEDPSKRARTALALFGTPLEDLNVQDIPKFLAGLHSTNNRLKDVSGAAKELDETLAGNAKASLTSFAREAQQFATEVLGKHVIPKVTEFGTNLKTNLGPAVDNVASGIKALPDPVKDFGLALGVAAIAGPKVVGSMQSMTAAAGNYVGSMRNAETRTQKLGAAAKTAAGVAGLGLLIASTQESNAKLRTFESIAGGAALGFSVGGPWGAAIGAGAGALLGLTTQTQGASDAQRELARTQTRNKEASDALRASLNQTTGAITKQSQRAMAEAIVKNRDFQTIMELSGVSLKTMTQAALGNEKAQNVLTLAMRAAKREGGLQVANIQALREELNRVGAPMRAEQKLIRETTEVTKKHTDSVQGLDKALHALPKKVVTDVLQMGADASRKDVERLQHQYDLTPKEVATVLMALGMEKAVGETARFRDRVNEIMDNIRDEGVDISLNAQTSKTLAQIAEFAPQMHAAGGRIYGKGSGTSDSNPAWVSRDEFIIRARVARQIYPFLEALNAGQAEAMQAAGGRGARFAEGGRVGVTPTMGTSGALGDIRSAAHTVDSTMASIADRVGAALSKAITQMLAFGGSGMPLGPGGTLSLGQIAQGQSFAHSQAGKPYVWTGVGPGGYDCSGAQSAVLNAAMGRYPHTRLGSTGTMPWSGSSPGVGRYTIGWFTGDPGHTSGNIGGLNVESSGGVGFHVGSSARSPLDGMFNGLMHYDRGGDLKPGLTLALNTTGRNERVVSRPSDKPLRIEGRLTFDPSSGEAWVRGVAREEIEDEFAYQAGG